MSVNDSHFLEALVLTLNIHWKQKMHRSTVCQPYCLHAEDESLRLLRFLLVLKLIFQQPVCV